MKRLIVIIISAVLLCTSLAFADSYDDMLTKAESYRSSGDYERAEVSYALAQRIDDQRIEAFIGATELMLELDKYSEAELFLDTVFSIDPTNAIAWALKCRIDVALGDTSTFKVDALYAEVCEADLNPYAADIAVMFSQAGQYNDAVVYFSTAESLTEEQQELYRRALVATGHRDRAAELGLMKDAMRNVQLDAAFVADNLTLKKVEMNEIKIEDFEFPDELWTAMNTEKPADPYAELRDSLAEADKTRISLSPAGNSGFYDIGNTLVTVYNGKYHILYPSVSRGVPDENENLQYYYQSMTSNYRVLGEEGVIYSPDGRYAAINNISYLVKMANYIMDPIIIDLSTGEMILTATYKNKARDELAGTVATGVFSLDGMFYYYILYGNTTENRNALYRFNLASGETELCCSIPFLAYYPYLCETNEGSLLIVEDQRTRDARQSIIQIEYRDGAWEISRKEFPNEMGAWYVNKLLHSANSGFAFIAGMQQQLAASIAFMDVNSDNEFDGLGVYYAIDRIERKVVKISWEEYFNSFEGTMDSETMRINTDLLPYACIYKTVLSPDGFYALLLAKNGVEDAHLYLINLENKEIREVKGIDASQIPLGSLASKYLPIVEWNTDTLIIYDGEGINTYQFDY